MMSGEGEGVQAEGTFLKSQLQDIIDISTKQKFSSWKLVSQKVNRRGLFWPSILGSSNLIIIPFM